MPAAPAPALAKPLPRLREDLHLAPDAPDHTGSRTWRLHDPLRETFFAVGQEAFDLLSQWPLASDVADLAARMQVATGRVVTPEDIREFSQFLAQAQLIDEPSGGWRQALERQDMARQGLFSGILHNYVFFKIPLFRPDAALRRTLPALRFLTHRVIIALWLALTLTGLYLASRQAGEVVEGLSRQMSLSGAALFAVTLFVMKIFHEMGHAYVATAMGCRVRSLGLGVMLLAPMLYTDVSDAWRLANRRKRIAIDIAGVAAEMAIAGLAVLAWALLPPGDARDVALVVATTAVVMTLAVNLSPFMRFDGYYILADVIGVKNLQQRAFQLVRWTIREALFGLGEPCPDTLRGRMRALVIAYGFTTMIYRFILFVGIAVAIYLMSFKVLGIILFVVEIMYFIVRPVWTELKTWKGRSGRILVSPRTLVSAGVVASIVLAACIPWSTTIRIPAVLESATFARLLPAIPAEIDDILVTENQMVEAGQLLVRMVSPRLDKELSVTTQRLELVVDRLARRIGDARDQSATLALEKERSSLLEKQAALAKQMASLAIRAPITGRVAGLDPDLHKGRVLSREDEIGFIIGEGGVVVRGYADQQDIWRLAVGDHARFIADNAYSPILTARLATIAVTSSSTLDIPHLSEAHGGHIRVVQQPNRPATPLDAIHLVDLKPDEHITLSRPVRGMALIDGKAQSLIAVLARRVMKVLIQEASA